MSKRDIVKKDPADFTPTLGDYTDLQPFRFWCQKVLPLVYDDSLSYYELLCKVVDYLNKTMEDVGVLESDVTDLHEAYKKLQSYVNEYFSSLDVQEEINNKLDAMAKDGSLSNLIMPHIKSSPIIVNSLSHMTDTSAIYLLESDGFLYYWNGSAFIKSGINYTYPKNAFISNKYSFFTSENKIAELNQCGSYAIGIASSDNYPADMPPEWRDGNYMVVVDGYAGGDVNNYVQTMYKEGTSEHYYRMVSNNAGEWIHVSSKSDSSIKIGLCGDSFIARGGDGGLPMSDYLNNYEKYNAVSLAQGGIKASEWWDTFNSQVNNTYDAFLISLGLNGETSVDVFKNSITAIINNLTTINPTARIILWCMDAWYTEEYSNACEEIASGFGIEFYSMKADARIPIRIGGKFKSKFPNLNDEYVNTKTNAYHISSEDNHPNISGRKLLAQYWATIL